MNNPGHAEISTGNVLKETTHKQRGKISPATMQKFLDSASNPRRQRSVEMRDTYFENYKMKPTDIDALLTGADTMMESGLLNRDVLDEVRIVSYDSEDLYVVSKGKHASNEQYKVEELPEESKTGFHVYKIKHSPTTGIALYYTKTGERLGRQEEDYRGGVSWFLADEIESTAINAKTFPNGNLIYQPTLKQPVSILDAVAIPPLDAYNKTHEGGEQFPYLTDVLFHEIGHIEDRRIRNWQISDGFMPDLPSEKQRDAFSSALNKSQKVPPWLIQYILQQSELSELYPMVIDREASRIYEPSLIAEKDKTFYEKLSLADSNYEERMRLEEAVRESTHDAALVLVRALEEVIPDFKERKVFLQSVMKIPHNSKE